MNQPELLFPVIVVAFAIGGAVFHLLSRMDERQVVRDSLRQLDGYEVESQRDAELLPRVAAESARRFPLEPYRQKLSLMQAKLAEAYTAPEEMLELDVKDSIVDSSRPQGRAAGVPACQAKGGPGQRCHGPTAP